MIAVALLSLGGWVWRVVRTQIDALTYSGLGFAYGDDAAAPSLSGAERIDLFVTSLDALLYAVLAIAVGLFLRAAADHMVVQSGGSLPRGRPQPAPEWPSS